MNIEGSIKPRLEELCLLGKPESDTFFLCVGLSGHVNKQRNILLIFSTNGFMAHMETRCNILIILLP